MAIHRASVVKSDPKHENSAPNLNAEHAFLDVAENFVLDLVPLDALETAFDALQAARARTSSKSMRVPPARAANDELHSTPQHELFPIASADDGFQSVNVAERRFASEAESFLCGCSSRAYLDHTYRAFAAAREKWSRRIMRARPVGRPLANGNDQVAQLFLG